LKYNKSELPKVVLTITENKTHYCFEVKDNGIGIPKEARSKVFDLFETSNVTDRDGQKGTGIGLATVKKLVHKLEGTIDISSTVEEGTKFTCIIPKG